MTGPEMRQGYIRSDFSFRWLAQMSWTNALEVMTSVILNQNAFWDRCTH